METDEGMGDSGAKTALFDQLARVGKALGSGKRLELLDLLAQGERTVQALADVAQLGLTTTSMHLQALKHAHLVATRRDGAKVFYRLAGPDIAALYHSMCAVATHHIADVEPARHAYLGPETAEISRQDLLDHLRSATTTLLDVRPAEEYAAAHIPGAICIPLPDLPHRLTELPRTHEVIVYGRSASSALAHQAVRMLTGQGYRTRRLTDGMLEWQLADLPVTSGSA